MSVQPLWWRRVGLGAGVKEEPPAAGRGARRRGTPLSILGFRMGAVVAGGRAKAAAAPTDVDVAAEGATPWRKWPATPPWMEPRRVGSGPSAGSTVRSNQEENAAISVQPLWWRRLGRSFIRGNGDDDALPVVQVKTAVWEWRWRERRGERRGSSLEVEDGVAEPAGR